jgi:hypothetical protein
MLADCLPCGFASSLKLENASKTAWNLASLRCGNQVICREMLIWRTLT